MIIKSLIVLIFRQSTNNHPYNFHTSGISAVSQKTLLLKPLVSSPAFNPMTS